MWNRTHPAWTPHGALRRESRNGAVRRPRQPEQPVPGVGAKAHDAGKTALRNHENPPRETAPRDLRRTTAGRATVEARLSVTTRKIAARVSGAATGCATAGQPQRAGRVVRIGIHRLWLSGREISNAFLLMLWAGGSNALSENITLVAKGGAAGGYFHPLHPRQVGRRPPLCHPERSRGTCSFTFGLSECAVGGSPRGSGSLLT